MDEIGLDSLDEAVQPLRGAADREGTEPLPDRRAQADGPCRGGTGALPRFFKSAKGNGDDLEPVQ